MNLRGMDRSEGWSMNYLTQNGSFTHCSSESGDAIARFRLLLREAEKSCPTSQQWDTIARHIAELRQLIYRQVELFEKGKLRNHREVEQVQNQLATLNDLMANYQTFRQRISALAK
jgi:hypothetical protein